jgi:hypothetical protein
MSRLNKQVLNDYFKSFFKQFSLTKEQFDKVRDLIDEAECGCCSVVTVNWISDDESAASPAAEQIVFKDENDEIVASTSITGGSPQRICVPREATTICINIIEAVTTGGTFTLTGSDGFSQSGADTVTEGCYFIGPLETSLPASSYIIVTAEP